jgi:hypothetical protein
MYTQHTLCLLCIYAIIKEVSEKTCFLVYENVVALLHYNNQAAAAVDYITFNFDNFSTAVVLYGQVLLKKAAMYGVKK